MIHEFLNQNAICMGECPFSDDRYYQLPYGLIMRIAEEFGLEYEHGETLSLVINNGDEINITEATVH